MFNLCSDFSLLSGPIAMATAALTHSSKSQATRFKRLTRRSASSKNRVLGELKDELRGSLGAKRPNYNKNNNKKSLAPLEDVQSAT